MRPASRATKTKKSVKSAIVMRRRFARQPSTHRVRTSMADRPSSSRPIKKCSLDRHHSAALQRPSHLNSSSPRTPKHPTILRTRVLKGKEILSRPSSGPVADAGGANALHLLKTSNDRHKVQSPCGFTRRLLKKSWGRLSSLPSQNSDATAKQK